MTFTSAQSKSLADSRKRDNKGHFIKATTKVSSPLDVKLNPEFEKPIVAVSINNPLRKIMYWLDQIRRHQTTTFAFKLSIPIIVIPVIIAAAFSVGRVSGLNIINQNPQQTLYSSSSPQPPVTLSRAGTLKIAKSTTATQYLLSLKSGDIVVLQVTTTIDLTKYANKQILVTGLYNKTTNTLKVTDIAEVQIFNPTVIPQESTTSAK